MSFLAHGRVPGLSADASAALGFLFFFGFGLPVLLIVIGTFAMSVHAGEKWLGVLAASLLVTAVLTMINVWTGVLGSLGYLSFAVWALVHRLRR